MSNVDGDALGRGNMGRGDRSWGAASKWWKEPSPESTGIGGRAAHTLEPGCLSSEPWSSSGVVGAPLEEDEEDGGWKSALLRRLRSGSTGLLFRERDRKKRFEAGALAGWWVWCVVEEAAVEEAASDLSERLEAKTAAIRRMGGTKGEERSRVGGGGN